MLTKITIEAALSVELDEHLGYTKHQPSLTENSRNSFSSKTLKTEDGQFEVDIPRDRHSEFEPQLIKKYQTRFTSIRRQLLCPTGQVNCRLIDSNGAQRICCPY